ncbi:DUF3857 domain-containing protein [Aequorivita marina]|uniref:DUF3857 domain-containing protein n=1 Tax=Aequorivita marina TaxID=3073654 RepID=UPI002874AC0B|nr:DUF3857 domain-containing protein [Aequorivita sp. S2608]MDS1297186.1 DUF3857 domain-containing protein [Aequorivita sp. S2608]
MEKIYCLLFLLCSAHVFAQNDYSLASINLGLTEYANSVLIDELVEVDVTNLDKVTTKTRRVVAVLNKMGNGDAKLFEYYNDNSKVKRINVRIYDALGKQIARYKKKDFIDVSRTGNAMYMDFRVLYKNYTPTAYPYIVVFESETETGDSAFIDSWFPLDGYAESTQKSVLKLKFNPANPLKYMANNLDGHDITITETQDELTFTATNIKAFRYEEHSPSKINFFPNVRLGLDAFKLKGTLGIGTNWQDFGKWMSTSLLSGIDELPDGTLARVKSLVANENTNEGKARKIYQYVQDKVRYISIQIGIGGWKPMPALEVDKLSYGDCKALTYYTKTLLDAVGVPSYYTVIYGDTDERDITADFTSLQGNHVILGIPDGEEITWLECTSQDTPYGYIGSFTDDRDALVITPEGGKIMHTKIYETEESLQNTSAKVKVNADGSVLANFESTSEGLQYEDKFLLPKKKTDEIDAYYKNRWGHINGFSIDGFEFKDDREQIAFTENVTLTIPNYANPVGGDYLFCANIFSQNSYIPPRIETRNQNLYIGYGYLDIDTVEVEIPANFIIDVLPESSVLETKFGKYEIDFSKTSENNLLYSRKLRIEKGEYPPAEYESYRAFLRSIARLDKTKILLKQNTN